MDSVFQQLIKLAAKKLLEAIYEQDFQKCSHGFRPNLSCHTAVKALDKVVMKKPQRRFYEGCHSNKTNIFMEV